MTDRPTIPVVDDTPHNVKLLSAPLSAKGYEALYRRLMAAYREQGEPAEALNVYRRCREMLSIVLGAKPSAETEAVRATLSVR